MRLRAAVAPAARCALTPPHPLRLSGAPPLSLDSRAQVPSIQQTAALALGRLANYSDDLAEAVVANDILPQLVYSLGEQNVRVARRGARRGRRARHAGACRAPR
jgi:hypothetical protein